MPDRVKAWRGSFFFIERALAGAIRNLQFEVDCSKYHNPREEITQKQRFCDRITRLSDS
jgi:hypothetical protein